MTTVEDLAPWVSLLAGLLSIGYLVLREWGQRADRTGAAGTPSPSLGDALATYRGTIVTAVTFFTIAGVAHLTLDVGQYVPPTALWLVVGALVVVVAVGEATDEA